MQCCLFSDFSFVFKRHIFFGHNIFQKVVYLEIYHFDFSQIVFEGQHNAHKTLYSYCFHLLNQFGFKVHLEFMLQT